MKSNLALLIDFGSTYTKVSAVDLAKETVAACAEAPTTVDTDIMHGLNAALEEIYSQLGTKEAEFTYKLACSSAAGGLRIVAIGLIRDLTVEAAKQAALGAGARVLGVYAHELTIQEINEIEGAKPEIVLLAGGTDGGNKEVILHNARMLAESLISATIIVAGNKVVADDARQILVKAGKEVLVTENVLPELDKLNVIPARRLIRQVFLDKIVVAKGLNRAESFVERILMPTPAAVLNAAHLLAKGTKGEQGLGDILLLDIGGATTDVHSLAQGLPTKSGISLRGLPQPYAKRTVEGDLGMRVSAAALYETVPPGTLEGYSGASAERVQRYIEDISKDYRKIPQDEEEMRIETAMAVQCAQVAASRHAGTLEVVWTPFGASYVQHGKDLTETPYLIGTGGVIVNHPQPKEILQGAIFKDDDVTVLKPKDPTLLLDEKYILAAMGLLAEVEPELALRIMKNHLITL
ncbi:methylaspartate mutase accessory protein GlmL [Desulfofalx alkaliphila]|uniref:methylaspartate mutase accessory protein GlmL n=1 Tax=Desulfofalx alkaliphila TaxID=105483 RepID=UPI0004E10530|nr:methylaspartate mutase accessory protein GlmL [Desulfofalx alkaliphila]